MARQKIVRERHSTPFPAFDEQATLGNAHAEPMNPLSRFKGLIKRLSEAYGPSGSEEPVRELVRDEIREFVDQVRVDALGNLIAQRRGNGNQRKRIMLAAHLDEIGIMVTYIDARGFARIGSSRGVKPSSLVGARVKFENGLIGVIAREDHDGGSKTLEMSSLFLDTGGSNVQVGEVACLDRVFVDGEATLMGKALNNRVGCAILIQTLRELKKSPHDISCVFTVQQNVGARGAGAAAFAIQPDMAFVIDAAGAADIPGADPNGLSLGKGPAIKFQDEGTLTSASARQVLMNAAREAHVPYQLDVTPRLHGDSGAIQAAREGVPTGALGLPMRYVGTASEMMDSNDAENAVKLLGALLTRPIG